MSPALFVTGFSDTVAVGVLTEALALPTYIAAPCVERGEHVPVLQDVGR